MKAFIKRHVSERVWSDLRSLRKLLKKRKWGSVASFPKLFFKDRMGSRKRLDYARGEIWLAPSSIPELRRMDACSKEPETIAWIESHMKPGDVFYDIGANVGAYSLVAAAVARGDAHIYAFEPSFSTFASLCRNIFLNNYESVIVPLQTALTDKTETVSFEYSDLTSGVSQHKLVAEMGDKPVQKMLGYRLDDIRQTFSLPAPQLIKIDVDGSEEMVLNGAARTLRDSAVRTILIEIDEGIDLGNKCQKIIESCGFILESKHARGGSSTLHNCIFKREQQ